MKCPQLAVLTLFALHNVFLVFSQDPPNECNRGVKRHHPSQANVYQVFMRKDYRKQWVDYSCSEMMIFDPRLCQCVKGQRQTIRKETPAVDRESNREESDGTEQQAQHHHHNQQQQRKPSLDDRNARKEQANQEQSQKPQGTVDVQGSQAAEVVVPVEDGSECSLHRPASDPTHFERWTDSKWEEEDCNWPFYTGLLWNQDTCRCEWGPNRTQPKLLAESSVPAQCLMMLKMTFEEGEIKDEGRRIWLNVRNKDNAQIVSDTTAVGGHCGAFRGASVSVPYFKSNVLGSVFHVGFMFKLCPGEPDVAIPLVHNDCPESGTGPSIRIAYEANKNHIVVSLRMGASDMKSEICALTTSQTKWTKVDVRYSDSYLEVSANDVICIESNRFFGSMATNNCPLSLLGEAFCGSIDEVLITRGCTDEHAVS